MSRPGVRLHARRYGTLVLADQSMQQSVLRRDGIERFEVQLAKLLNVDRATILEKYRKWQ